MSLFKLLAVPAAAAPLALGLAYAYARPEYAASSLKSIESPMLRRVGSTRELPPASNPGVDVFPLFASASECEGALEDCGRLVRSVGFDPLASASPLLRRSYERQMEFLRHPPPVNMLRVTGRPEINAQTCAPWGYADAFDDSQIPPAIRHIADRIVRDLGPSLADRGIHMGPLRDITVNFRKHSFFRLDPHIDPMLDGPHVFIIGLDSDTVLTLSPNRWLTLTTAINHIQEWWYSSIKGKSPMDFAKSLQRKQSTQSWTPHDIDILARKGSLVLLTGPARYSWTHATRLGVESENATGKSKLWDWFGVADDLVERMDRRHSIVLAFGEAKPETSK